MGRVWKGGYVGDLWNRKKVWGYVKVSRGALSIPSTVQVASDPTHVGRVYPRGPTDAVARNETYLCTALLDERAHFRRGWCRSRS